MPKKKELRSSCFCWYANYLSLPSNWNILYKFLTCFASFYTIFMKAKCFMWTNAFRRKKNVEMLGLHPQRNMSIMRHLHSYILINNPSFGGICWWQNCRLWFLRCLPFWAPRLFWLSRFNLDFSFQHVNAGNGIKSHNTL